MTGIGERFRAWRARHRASRRQARGERRHVPQREHVQDRSGRGVAAAKLQRAAWPRRAGRERREPSRAAAAAADGLRCRPRERGVGLHAAARAGGARLEPGLVRRLWRFMNDAPATSGATAYLQQGIELLHALQVDGVELDHEKICFGPVEDVTTWQIGQRLHVLHGDDVFCLGAGAAVAWRSLRWCAPCVNLLGANAEPAARTAFAEFARLGLLVVDEEHRFGVRHKERIKQLKHLVDCLTLTATPIPRTLQMSLLGARDLSVINTPPLSLVKITSVSSVAVIRSSVSSMRPTDRSNS